MRLLLLLPAIALLLLPAACGRTSDTDRAAATPLRRAYPRLPAYDSAYAAHESAGLRLELNASATVADTLGGRWLTVGYPLHSSRIYITVTRAASPAELQSALDNRRHRISLNLGDIPGQTIHTESDGGFEGAVVEAPGAGTPVQFVATDGEGYLVSGAAHIDVASDAPYDSISPVVATLRRDVIHLLTTLRRP